MIWPHSVSLEHCPGVQERPFGHAAVHREKDLGAGGVIDQLHEVTISGDHHSGTVDGRCRACQHIICLVVRDADPRDSSRIQQRCQGLGLRSQCLRLLLLPAAIRSHVRNPVRLVGGHQLHPPLRAPTGIPAGHDARGREPVLEGAQHRKEAAQRLVRTAIWSLHRVREGMEAAVVQGRGVKQQDGSSAHAHILAARMP